MTVRTDYRHHGEASDEIRAEVDAVAHVHGICLKTGPPGKVGVELEWLVRDAADPSLTVPPARIARAARPFTTPSGARPAAAQPPGAPSPAAQPAAAQPRWAQPPASGSGSAAGHPPPPSAGPLIPAARAAPRADAAPTVPSPARPGLLPSGASLTAEPGGQLELSSLPADSLEACVTATMADMAALRAAAGEAGLELAGYGLDPLRRCPRILNLPRYAAMEAFFDRGGPWGRQMMCGTASVQVCLDAGDDGDGPAGFRYRWRLAHAIGPVLVAAFANSPLRDGRPTGWRSARQQVWAHMDPTRTRPPRLNGGDPREAWARYALDAEVMLVRDDGSPDWSAPPKVPFRGWVNGALGFARPPTREDLSYHLSTLFPPVRPRGHLELRMIDAQPGDGWVVPLAVTAALAHDGLAGDAALAATEPLAARGGDPWLRAAWLGPSDAALCGASRECFAAARAALDRMGAPAGVTAAVDAFIEDYVDRGRCPADDMTEDPHD